MLEHHDSNTPRELPWYSIIRKLSGLLGPHKLKFGLYVCLLLAMTFMALSGPLLVKHAIDVNIMSKDYTGLWLTVGLFLVLQLIYIASRYFLIVGMEKMGQTIITDLKVRVFQHINSQSLSFFHRTSAGKLLTRVEGDTDYLRNLFTSSAIMLVGNLVLCIGMFTIMAIVDWRLTVILAVLFLPLFYVVYLLNTRLSRHYLDIRKITADITGFVTEYIQGMSIVQAFCQEKRSAKMLSVMNEKRFRKLFKTEFWWITLFTGIFFIETLGIISVLWLGGRWIMAGTLSIGSMFMFIGYIRRFFEPLHHLTEQVQLLQKAVAGARRIFDILALKPEIEDPVKPIPWQNLEEGITFEHVSFAYNTDEWVLKDMNFFLPKGESWALVGRTGSGKTTITNLLFRFHDPQKGRILVDGIDIRCLRQMELREKIGLVLQDILLFPGNILDNLRLFDQAISPKVVEKAARTVQAHTFISQMPAGYESMLIEGGGNLSGGERQLLSFARALIFDPEILIMDEATSSVDPVTEKQIQEALSVLLEGRTSLIIAHRLATIQHCDRILLMENGHIIEEGAHAELLAFNGHYKELYQLQLNGKQHAVSR